MLVCDPRFRTILNGFNPPSLERHAGPVLGLWNDCTIAYLNPAWYEFSRDNNGEPAISTRWDLGASILGAIGQPLLPFYLTAFSDCCHAMTPWEHIYECSSAEQFRKFHMKVYPLTTNGEMLFVHSLVVECPHDPSERPPHAADEMIYRDQRGTIHQCLHCRRVRHGVDQDRWDWVPAWVHEQPTLVNDALCPPCDDYHYGRR